MASNIVKFSLFFGKLIESTSRQILGGVRYASKKISGGHTRTSPRGLPKHYGPWKNDGNIVTAGTILARQYKIRYCPGLNVGYGASSLYAKVPGKVIVTCEATNFNTDHALVGKYYPDRPVMYKKYFHVIPEPQHNRFKLIETN